MFFGEFNQVFPPWRISAYSKGWAMIFSLPGKYAVVIKVFGFKTDLDEFDIGSAERVVTVYDLTTHGSGSSS